MPDKYVNESNATTLLGEVKEYVDTGLGTKQATIDSSHKLSADLISDGVTNKVFTATEQTKLSSIESGAQVNTVTSVNSKTGVVSLSASDVGALPSSTKYGSNLNLSGTLLQLQDQDGNSLGSAVTLPETGITSVQADGEGNAFTSQSVSGGVLTLTKGTTFATPADVADAINSVSAYYITRNSNGDPFQTYAQLSGTSTFYSGGVVRIPTTNDYCIVLADITQATIVSGYDSFTTTAEYVGYYVLYNNVSTLVTNTNKDSVGITAGTTVCYLSIPTTRYSYQNNQWEFQFIVSEASFTTEQWAAINSGLTATDKTKLDGIEAGAQVNTIESISLDGSSISPDGNKNVNIVLNDKYVSLSSQTLTEEQKAQVRTNIGAGSANATSVIVGGSLVASLSFDSDPQTQISGKQNIIDSTHKLSADLVEDGTTNKVFTATEQSKLSNLQNDSDYVHIAGNETITGAKLFNNRPKVDTSELPSAYQPVEYIQSYGNEYIDTGVLFSDAINGVETHYYKSDATPPQGLFGVRTAYVSTYFNFRKDSNARYAAVLYGDETAQYYSSMIEMGIYPPSMTGDIVSYMKQTATATIKYAINDAVGTYGRTVGTTTSNLHYYLFAINNNGTAEAKFECKLYYFKIYANDVLIRDFKPCYRKSDNEVGLYDVVNDVFYTNQGSGAFTKGNDVGKTEVALVSEIPTTADDVGVSLTTTSGSEAIIVDSDSVTLVTRNTDQNITGTKTFVGQQKVKFKQSSSSDKLGLTLYNPSNKEISSLQYSSREMRPVGSGSSTTYDFLALQNYTGDATNYHATQVGVRSMSDDTSSQKAFNFLFPKDTKANMNAVYGSDYDTIYLNTAITDGTTTKFADKNGVVNVNDLIPVKYTEDTTGSADPSPFADYYNKSTTDTLLGAKANNTASNLTDANVESWRSKLGIKDLPYCSIIHSTVPLYDASLKLANGELIYQGGAYNAFYDYMVALYTAGTASNCFTTESAYQTSISTYGVCGKYVYDSTNHTIRIPTLKGILEGVSSNNDIGAIKPAGLPNITGQFSSAIRDGMSSVNLQDVSGAFGTRNPYSQQKGADYTTINWTYGLNFDASRSNSIYGNSNTVQPQTTGVYYYIVVASSVKTEIEVDIDEIATDLNGKADISLNNFQSSLTSSSVTINSVAGTKYVGGHICIESWKSNDGKQWYRKYSDGWKECGYNNFTGSSWALQTWTFPIAFSSVNSFAVFNKAVYTGTSTSGNNLTINSYAVYGKTTSSAKIYSDSGWIQDLYACGY
jgi:hypothetical protein